MRLHKPRLTDYDLGWLGFILVQGATIGLLVIAWAGIYEAFFDSSWIGGLPWLLLTLLSLPLAALVIYTQYIREDKSH